MKKRNNVKTTGQSSWGFRRVYVYVSKKIPSNIV